MTKLKKQFKMKNFFKKWRTLTLKLFVLAFITGSLYYYFDHPIIYWTCLVSGGLSMLLLLLSGVIKKRKL